MSKINNIPEVFLHYLWKHRLFTGRLKSVHGDQIHIIHPGQHNRDAGPDFLYARIRIGNTTWAGNVEIHLKSSDWYKHHHDSDKSYNSVILHVVMEHDKAVKNTAGDDLHTLCISDAFDSKLLLNYEDIMHNLLWVPCQNQIGSLASVHLAARIDAEAIQRLFNKAEKIRNELLQLNMDWEECCYRQISRQFGARVNTSNFEMLCKTLPVRILKKHQNDLFHIESLLFGQSGLLNTIRIYGSYPYSLKKEHAYLAGKYALVPMPGYLWKFMRMRPAGFPSLRIAQLAALYHKRQSVFQEIIECENILSLFKLFDLTASKYWDDHYIFNKKSKLSKKTFGKLSIQLLLINAVIPLIHLYGKEMNKPFLCERARQYLLNLPPENNAIIRRWSSIGVQANNAMESQGLLQLKKHACDKKRCLECSIGHQLLKSSS